LSLGAQPVAGRSGGRAAPAVRSRRPALGPALFLFLQAATWVAAVLCLVGLLLAADQPTLKDWAKGPAGVLLSSQERGQLRKLNTDDQRSAFIDRFWATRDPDPTTRNNEFREEFERRLEIVSRDFGERARPGWQTLRGQVYLVLGPPYRVEPRLFSGLRAQFWYYNDLPLPLDPNSALIFADLYRDGRYYLLPQFRFGDSRFERNASLFELSALTYSLPTDAARALEDVNKRAVSHPEAQLSEGARVTKEAGAAIPYELSTRTRPAAGDQVALDVRVSYQVRDLALREGPEGFRAPLLLTAVLRAPKGAIAAQGERRETVQVPRQDLEASATAPARLLELTLDAAPGKYDLEVELRDEELTSAGTYTRKVEVDLSRP
jgi:GWxTD domain-containing protein